MSNPASAQAKRFMGQFSFGLPLSWQRIDLLLPLSL
jgi:hypothetical protein